MKPEEIRDLTNDEINDRIVQNRDELFKLRFRSATQQLENPALIRNLKRDIARLQTILRQREMAETK